MKRILVTLTFALGALTIASAVVSKDSSSVLDQTTVLSDNNPPPICPPICPDPSSDGGPIIIRHP